MRTCRVYGCEEELTKPGHELCRRHWGAEHEGKLDECDCGAVFESRLPECPRCENAGGAGDQPSSTSTKIGKHFQLSPQRMNLVLAELGWIARSKKGWVPTDQGARRKAVAKHARQTGIPYVIWPAQIVEDRVLLSALDELRTPEPSEQIEDEIEAEPTPGATRPTQPGSLRATDGHLVRSRGELVIDNWLYMEGVVHAYERKLTIDEEAYCDFWIPAGHVYIEYWGLEGKPGYDARRQAKLDLYSKYGLKLIEITNKDIEHLDDVLPAKLRQFGISTE